MRNYLIDETLKLDLINFLKNKTRSQGHHYNGEFYFCEFCHSESDLDNPTIINHGEICSGINWLNQLENLVVR